MFGLVQCQGLYGYGQIIAQLLVQPSQRSTETYRYSVNYLTGNERAGDALTKYIRKKMIRPMTSLSDCVGRTKSIRSACITMFGHHSRIQSTFYSGFSGLSGVKDAVLSFIRYIRCCCPPFYRSFSQLDSKSELGKRLRNDYARVLCRSGKSDLSAFVVKDFSLTLLDALWLAIAHSKVNQRPEAIEG